MSGIEQELGDILEEFDESILSFTQDEKAMDKGPWQVRLVPDEEAGFGCQVYVESDDFTHDVMLSIGGDFRSLKQKHQYAVFISGELNKDRHRREILARRDISNA